MYIVVVGIMKSFILNANLWLKPKVVHMYVPTRTIHSYVTIEMYLCQPEPEMYPRNGVYICRSSQFEIKQNSYCLGLTIVQSFFLKYVGK
jgi:hypothetical protein